MELKPMMAGLMLVGLVVSTSFLTARWARATGVPGLIPVQGCATDNAGKALEGSQQVEFRLYASSNAPEGDALHTETRTVNFRGCVFSEMLHPSNLDIFEKNPATYLGIKIGSDAELSPRFELGAAPYAAQARHADRASSADNGVPPGTIVAFGGATPPPGWLLCDGSIVDGSTYPLLAAAIGMAWGNGANQVGKFNLPDLRGQFLRGVSGATNQDPGKDSRTASNPGGNEGNLVGSVQQPSTALPSAPFVADTTGSHSHDISMRYDKNMVAGGGGFYTVNSGSPGNWASSEFMASTAGAHSHTISGGDQETRPRNAYVNYIIKY